MNQTLRKYLAISLIAALSIMGLSGCTNETRSKKTDSKSISRNELIMPVEKQVGNIKVSVDPRIELLTAIRSQADDYTELLSQQRFNYREEVFTGFRAYKNEAVVKRFKKMMEKGYSFDAPPATMLYYGMPPALELEIDVPQKYISRAGGKKQLNQFMQEAANFANVSNFSAFFNAHDEFYKAQINEVAATLEKDDLAKDLDDFYGLPHGDYKLILSFMSHGGGYGPRVIKPDRTMDIYGIIGPTTSEDGMPKFMEHSVRGLIWHEFSHSYVNPLTDIHKDQVKSLEKLYEPIRDNMSQMAYPEWEICLNEHIIRAINVRFTETHFGKDRAMEELESEYDEGFIYIKALYEAICQYDNNRNVYKSFDQYYPELLKVLEQLNSKAA